MRVAAAQDAPVFLDRSASFERVIHWMEEAAKQGVELVAFGETFVPGYPFWLSETQGAAFDHPQQKETYAAYLDAAVGVDGPELAQVRSVARELGITAVLGIAERGPGPASGSIYCSIVVVHPERGISAPHRKLVPTFEERLVWAHGDGHGLRAHEVAGVQVSVLNCWENWMPMARHACWATGAELHVAIWPGSERLTKDITRFAAREGRVYVLSASAVLEASDLPELPVELPAREGPYFDGGSAIAGPDGEWVVAPVVGERGLVIADIDLARVRAERQNFDATGHYTRPDVFDLRIDRRRRSAARWIDEPEPQ